MVLSSVPVSVFAEAQEPYKYECEEEHSEEVTAGSTEEKSSQEVTVTSTEGKSSQEVVVSSIGDDTEEDAPESSIEESKEDAPESSTKESTEDVTESGTEEESTETSAPSYTADDVKAMLNALPSVSELEGMSEAERSSIYEQAQEVYDAFESLTDEEQIGLEDDLVKLRDVMDYLTTFTMPLGPAPVSKLGLTVTVPNYALYYANAQSWNRIKLTSVDVVKNGKNLTVTWTIRYFESDLDWSNNRNQKTATWTYTINDFSCEKDVNITLKDYRNTTNKYWSTFTITRSAGHDYKEGICICGEYPPAIKNSEDYYEIGNLSQLMWFANQVNSKTITAHKAKLTADITIDNSFVWKPITLEDKSSSIFDGNGQVVLTKNQLAVVWNVGDKVEYVGDDGETYNCIVIEKNDGICTLLTNGYVAKVYGKYYEADWYENRAASIGGRLPDGASDTEKLAVKNKLPIDGYSVCAYNGTVYNLHNYGGNAVLEGVYRKWSYDYYFYVVFDVPSL